MFDGLLGRKFSSKCKSLIKLTKVRVETIKKKRNSVQKYLRNDIADLLKSGHDINAYGRAEGLLVELNMSSCYDMIEQFYSAVSTQISVMDKQKECPEECREAVSSLMYAAARFADLPELRDLRNVFTRRYGNTMEAFVNKEFVEKLKSKAPTKDMKLKLMQDIAQNSSIEWNSKALEQKLYVPPPQLDHQKTEPIHNTNNDGYRIHKIKEDAITQRPDQNITNKASAAQNLVASKREQEDLPFRSRKEGTNNDHKKISEVKNVNQDDQNKSSNTPFYSKLMSPPPYVRSKPTPPVDFDETSSNKENVKSPKSIKQKVGDGPEPDQKQKPRSVRRRNLKLPPGREKPGDDGKTGLQILCKNNDDQKHNEEKLMDNLLLHYCKKESPYDTEKIKSNSSSSLVQNGGNFNNNGRAKSFSPRLMENEAIKVPPRASSFEPEMMMNLNGHVHPKLPDCDDLAARVAALSRNSKIC